MKLIVDQISSQEGDQRIVYRNSRRMLSLFQNHVILFLDQAIALDKQRQPPPRRLPNAQEIPIRGEVLPLALINAIRRSIMNPRRYIRSSSTIASQSLVAILLRPLSALVLATSLLRPQPLPEKLYCCGYTLHPKQRVSQGMTH